MGLDYRPYVRPCRLDEAQLAAVGFLARYSGRTLDAYRHDLRNLFQWAADHGLPGLEATRPTSRCTDRRWRNEGWQRRPSTDACPPRAASTVSPTSTAGLLRTLPNTCVVGLDRGELGRFLFAAERFDHPHAVLAVLLGLNGLRVSEACGGNIEDMAFERGHRVLRIVGKGNKPALIPLVPRTARTIDLAVAERREGPILLRHDGQRLDRAPHTAGSARSANGQGAARAVSFQKR